jgi:hypothetical protein
MIDTSTLKDAWGWEPTSTPGTVQKKLTAPASSSTSGTTGGGTVANSTFNYPSEWGQAGDVWSQMASGNYSNTGMDWLKNLLGSGGSQGALQQWGAAQQPAMMDQFSNMTKQMAEQAGVGGARYGSGLQNAIGNYGGQLQNQFQSNLMDRWLQAQGQDVNTASLLSQLGLGTQQTGAEGLMGLGNYKNQLPLQVAGMMGNLGQSLTNQQIDPWTQMMSGILGNTAYAQPQTYQPTAWQQMLQGLPSTLSAGLNQWDQQGWWG